MFSKLKTILLIALCAATAAAQDAASRPKQLSHVERFSTPEMRAGQTETEMTARLSADDKDPEAFNSRAVARVRLGKYREAEEDLRRAAALNPKNAEYRANLGYVLWKLGKYDEAIKTEREALRLDGKNYTANYQLGRFLLRAGGDGEVREALTYLRRALEIDPRQYEVRFELIAAYRSLNDLANAAAQLELLQDARPSDARVIYVRALLSADRGELASAVNDFLEALRKDKDLIGAWQDLGLAYIKLKKWDAAAETFAELVRRQPDSADFSYFHALALYNAGKVKEAETETRRALRLNAGAEEAHILLGIILASSGKNNSEAVESLSQAAALNPKSFDANFYLGRVQYTLKDYSRAIEALQKAVAINPNHAEARFFLGTVLEISGNSADALTQYEELVRLEPNSVFGQLGLGALLVKQGKMDEAVAALRKAVQLDPGNFESHWALGRALILSEKFEEAVASFREAVKAAPERAEAHYQLGLALRRLGRTEEAAREFEIVEKLNREFRTNATPE